MKRALIVLLVVAAVAAAAGSGWYYYKLKSPRLNVVLVGIDGLRASHLGCYGYEKNTSPAMDRLAAEGASFATVASSTTWSLPAYTALLTGLPDLVHRVTDINRVLDTKRRTLAEALQRQGYRTAAIFTSTYLRPRFRLDQGFEKYMDATGVGYVPEWRRAEKLSRGERTTVSCLDRAEEWLSGLSKQKPFFLFLQLSDLSPHFMPPEPYNTMFDPDYGGIIDGREMFRDPRIKPDMPERELDHLKALYDGEIRFVDDKGIARLISILEANGFGKNTMVIITSPYGFEFFEHGRLGYGHNLYDTTLSVPLIIWRPGVVPHVSIKNQANLVDVMPTVLDVLGLPPAKESMGQTLTTRFADPDMECPVPMYAELSRRRINIEAIRQTGFKLILDHHARQALYFELDRDPAERSPLTDPEQKQGRLAVGKFQAMKKELQNIRQSLHWTERDTQGSVDARQLENVGYFRE